MRRVKLPDGLRYTALGTTLASPLLAAVVRRVERLPPVSKHAKHPKDLDPKMARVFAFLTRGDGGAPDPESQGKSFTLAMRQRADAMIARVQGLFMRVEGVETEDLEIPCAHGKVRARAYRPENAKAPLRIIHYCHGGGFLFCNIETHDVLCQALARRADALVVSVEYRLAPEHPFPASADDAYVAYRWLIENGAKLGGDPKRIAVAGDSAGGNLAATVAIRARADRIQRPTMQLLIYPFLDLASQETESHRLFGGGPYWITTSGVGHARGQYLGESRNAHDPLVSPLRVPDASGLPPALVVTAACDPLRDEGEAYVAKLQAAGVSARGVRFAGMGHGFMSMLGIIPDAVTALEECAEALRKT